MVACTVSSGTDIGDHFSFLHELTISNADGRTVRIQSLISVTMINHHVESVTATPGINAVCNRNSSRISSNYWRACSNTYINPSMELLLTRKRVCSVTEP